MRQIIRLMLAIEAACFIAAGAIHSGLLVAVDIHHQAAIAESVIGAVLLISLALTWIWPNQTWLIGLIVQAFATLGTLVGVYTIIVGFGPRGAADLVAGASATRPVPPPTAPGAAGASAGGGAGRLSALAVSPFGA